MSSTDKWVSLLLRIGIAAVFLYATISATLQPDNWVGYLPGFLTQFIPAALLLKLFSTFQIILALWLLSGWMEFYAALVSALLLAGIIVTNFSVLDVTFRDIPIIFSAIALALLSQPKKHSS